jgi:hypothetical protein
VLYLEVHPTRLRERGESTVDIFRPLLEAGFAVHQFGHAALGRRAAWADLLAPVRSPDARGADPENFYVLASRGPRGSVVEALLGRRSGCDG